MLPPEPDKKWTLARQVGVTHAISSPRATARRPAWDFDALVQLKMRFADAGFTLAGFEGDPVDMRRIKLGLDGRDEDIERYCTMLHNLGAAGIPMICYNFMAQIGWYRTSFTTPERGGALVSSFDRQLLRAAPPTEAGEVSEAQMWDNLAYFVKGVIPVAEAAGVRMALHPDDPPVSPLRGIGRILTSVGAFERALALAPSEYSGVAFCQGTFKTMGADLRAAVRRFGERGKIFFVHFRDIRGSAERFQETFHDNGPTDMPAMLSLYHAVGFDGPIRPDHTPTMAGAGAGTPGYEALGRLFAVGYMKGIAEGLGIPLV